MARKDDNVFSVPFQDEVVGGNKKLSFNWETFFRILYSVVAPLGNEKSFQLKNNQATASDIDGLQFDFEKVNHVIVDVFIQRVSQGGPGITPVELLESATLHLVFKPKTAVWALTKIPGHGSGTSGITFSITAGGQVQYISDNRAGDFAKGISKLTYRAKTLSAKFVQPKFGWL